MWGVLCIAGILIALTLRLNITGVIIARGNYRHLNIDGVFIKRVNIAT